MDKIKIEKEAIVLDVKERTRLKEILTIFKFHVERDEQIKFKDGGKVLPFVKYLSEEL